MLTMHPCTMVERLLVSRSRLGFVPLFSFSGLPDGEYTLVVPFNGCAGAYPPLPVTVSGQDHDVTFVLPFPTLSQISPAATGQLRVEFGQPEMMRFPFRARCSADFSPDGRLLAPGDQDSRILTRQLP